MPSEKIGMTAQFVRPARYLPRPKVWTADDVLASARAMLAKVNEELALLD